MHSLKTSSQGSPGRFGSEDTDGVKSAIPLEGGRFPQIRDISSQATLTMEVFRIH